MVKLTSTHSCLAAPSDRQQGNSVLSSNRGSTLVVLIVATMLVSTALMLNGYLEIFDSYRAGTRNRVAATTLASSAAAEMIAILRTGRSFDPRNLSFNPPSTDIDAWLADPYNTARLIMPRDQQTFINEALHRPANDRRVLIEEMSFVTKNIADWPATNPMRDILALLPDAEVGGVEFSIKRLDGNLNYPQTSSSVFLEISVGVRSGRRLLQNRLIEAKSVIALTPRQHADQALIGGIADLDTSYATRDLATRGSMVFGAVSSIEDLRKSDGSLGGIQVMGPAIFQELRLPSPSRYASVAFNDVVTVSSSVKSPSPNGSFSPWRPNNAQLTPMSELPNARFLRGVREDIADRGLAVFMGLELPPPMDTTDLVFCANYGKSFMSLETTENSALGVTSLSSPSSEGGGMTARYRLAWNHYNAMMEQNSVRRSVRCNRRARIGCQAEPLIGRMLWDRDNHSSALLSIALELKPTNGGKSTNVVFHAGRQDRLELQLRQSRRALSSGPPTLIIETLPWIVGNDVQQQQMELRVSTSNWANTGLELTTTIISADKGSSGNLGRDDEFSSLRPKPVASNQITLHFPNQGQGLIPPRFDDFDTTTGVSAASFPEETDNTEEKAKICNQPPPPPPLFADYSDQAADFSWSVTHEKGNQTTVVFDSSNASWSPVPRGYRFPYYGVPRRVLIEPEAELVGGFIFTDHLEIKPGRTKPLYIVGTVVAKKLSIPPDAAKMGVSFIPATSPLGISIARSVGWLGRGIHDCNSPGNRNQAGTTPAWALFPSLETVSAQLACSAANYYSNRLMVETALRSSCGLPAGGVNTVCTGEKYYRTVVPISFTVGGI